MVGSFAPVHEGHLDAMRSAERRLISSGDDIAGNIFAPNSDSYVLEKLSGSRETWDFGRRVGEFAAKDCGTISRAYVDDISGLTPPEQSISEKAIDTASNKLGIEACRLILVVGTDQIRSMQTHIATNRAVCVLRPGYEDSLGDVMTEGWFQDAVHQNQLLLTSRENMYFDISSTQIRKKLEQRTAR